MEELNAIYERMRAIFAEEAGFVPNDGCDAMVRLYALASEVQSLLAQADWVLDQSFPQTAVGQYLDYHAETRALARLPAAKATGVLRFSAPSAAVTDYEWLYRFCFPQQSALHRSQKALILLAFLTFSCFY